MTGRRAEWRYALLVFLFWLPTGLYLATKILLMLDRGLGVAAIGTVVLVFSLTTAALELPTGGLADVIGRRTVLAASAVASCAGLALLAVADGFWLFAASAVLRGIARALSSGPDEAWFVDTMHAAEGPDAYLTRGLARGEAASSVGLLIGTLVGGALPLAIGAVGPLSALAVPVAIAALVEVVRLAVTLGGMPEPPRPRTTVVAVLRGVPATVSGGLRLGLRDGVLARLLLAGAGVGVALAAIELLTPGWLAGLVGDPARGATTYATVAAAGFGASAVGSLLGPWVQRRLGSAVRAGMAGIALGAAALLGVAVAGPALHGAVAGVTVIAAAYLLLFVGLGITAAPQAAVLHARVAAGERATVVSVQSLALQAAGALGSVCFGWLATTRGAAFAFGVAGAALAAAAWVMARIQLPDPTSDPAVVPDPAVQPASLA
ncbi:MFS transporter [Asanoa sp. NPDC049573]|uniref:MFS transporter n=1 Tax=Asanoa sp. NPDC049573 TaxID=3155396 RepID=UPI003437836E